MHKLFPFLAILLSIVLSECNTTDPQSNTANTLHIYSSRDTETDRLVRTLFEKRTGVNLKVTVAPARQLIERMEEVAEHPDLLITEDTARLNWAKSKGFLARLDVTNLSIPFELIDPDHFWTAIGYGATVIAYRKGAVDPTQLRTYADLARPKWKGQLLISDFATLPSLAAWLLYNYGEENTKLWTSAISENATHLNSDGQKALELLLTGEKNIAVVDAGSVTKILHHHQQAGSPLGEKIGLIFPDQGFAGTHKTIQGIAITSSSQHAANARQFLEFVTSKEVQEIYAQQGYEYPVNYQASIPTPLREWTKWQFSDWDHTATLYFTEKASEIFGETRWQ